MAENDDQVEAEMGELRASERSTSRLIGYGFLLLVLIVALVMLLIYI